MTARRSALTLVARFFERSGSGSNILGSRAPTPPAATHAPSIPVFQHFRNVTAAVALVSLSSCASMAGNLLPAGLGEVLGGVTGLTGKIADWQGSLGAALDGSALDTLKGFVDSAGDLGGKVTGFTDMVSDAARDPLSAIGSKLTDLGGFDVSALQNIPGADQLGRVQEFASSAGDLGSITTDFLSQFGG